MKNVKWELKFCTTTILNSFHLVLSKYARYKYAYAVTGEYVTSKFIVSNKTVC